MPDPDLCQHPLSGPCQHLLGGGPCGAPDHAYGHRLAGKGGYGHPYEPPRCGHPKRRHYPAGEVYGGAMHVAAFCMDCPGNGVDPYGSHDYLAPEPVAGEEGG